jgi:hypothetical protein
MKKKRALRRIHLQYESKARHARESVMALECPEQLAAERLADLEQANATALAFAEEPTSTIDSGTSHPLFAGCETLADLQRRFDMWKTHHPVPFKEFDLDACVERRLRSFPKHCRAVSTALYVGGDQEFGFAGDGPYKFLVGVVIDYGGGHSSTSYVTIDGINYNYHRDTLMGPITW